MRHKAWRHKTEAIRAIEKRDRELRRCPYCDTDVRATAFKRHVRESHPKWAT